MTENCREMTELELLYCGFTAKTMIMECGLNVDQFRWFWGCLWVGVRGYTMFCVSGCILGVTTKKPISLFSFQWLV